MINQRPLVCTLKVYRELLTDEGLWQASVDDCIRVSKTHHGPDAVGLNFWAQPLGVQIQADAGLVACEEVSGGELTGPLEPFIRRGGLRTLQ